MTDEVEIGSKNEKEIINYELQWTIPHLKQRHLLDFKKIEVLSTLSSSLPIVPAFNENGSIRD